MKIAIGAMTGKTQAQVFRSKSRCLKTTKQLIDLAKSMNARITDLTDGTKILTFRDGTKRTIQIKDLLLDAVQASVQELGEYLAQHPDQISKVDPSILEMLTYAEYFVKAAMNEYTTDPQHCREVATRHLETLTEDYPQIFSKKNTTRELN
ncbi:hypothetical protein B9G53_17625 [Pseudanabaena sp. SR411]|uniref:hypothetical protein n=1 Tax=Pseudanabaena sp. SR411 TaxID=1980935 RepID=UPI000B9804C2|nr:hypothetical protein [Pseudanabaena sp. SR411]OYQ63302.1 hypothetical protein B9G53_17625 [Pseudanabaena sp. SR411]